MDVGVIGLGHIGNALAHNLLKAGHRVAVFDIIASAADPIVAAGALRAKTPEHVAEISEAVLTCLPSPAASELAVFAEDGVMKGLRPGAAWIETSTVEPEWVRRSGRKIMEQGFAFLEAPLSGGVHKARSGRITVMVGGEAAFFERYKSLFSAVAERVIHVGALGQASEIKIITNLLMFINSIGIGEGLMLAKRAGIDLRTAYDVLCATVGQSWVLENEGQLVLSGSYNIEYTMALAAKDLGLATGLAEKLGVPLRAGGLTAELYAQARARFGDSAWSTKVVKLLEDELGEDLRAPGFPERLTDS